MDDITKIVFRKKQTLSENIKELYLENKDTGKYLQ